MIFMSVSPLSQEPHPGRDMILFTLVAAWRVGGWSGGRVKLGREQHDWELFLINDHHRWSQRASLKERIPKVFYFNVLILCLKSRRLRQVI